MNDTMPCGLEDDRIRYEPEIEDTDPRTDFEKKLEWLTVEWAGAFIDDNYEGWRDIRMMAYGATQTLINSPVFLQDGWSNWRNKTLAALGAIGGLAHVHSCDCIRDGKYEGAPK